MIFVANFNTLNICIYVSYQFYFEFANIIKRHPRNTKGMDETRYKWCRI